MTDDPKRHAFSTVEGHKFSGVGGKLHSEDDEPSVIYADGTKWWYRHGEIHRDGDKPAVVWSNGVQEWWQNNKRHRDNGPAVIFPNTDKIDQKVRGKQQWWLHGYMIRTT